MRFPHPLFMADAGAASSAASGGSAPGGSAASSPPAAGAGGAAAAGDPGRTAPTGLGTGSEPGTGAAPAWKAPDYLPEHLRGEDVAKTFERVAADWKAQRDRIAALPQAPKSVDDYAFEPSERAKPFVGDLKADPAFALMREAALKAGIPKEQFAAVVGGFYDGLVEKGLAPKPYDVNAERAQLYGPGYERLTPQEREAALLPMLTELQDNLTGLERTAAFDADPKKNAAAVAALFKLADTADGVRALRGLLKAAQANAPQGLIPGGQTSQAQSASPADLRKRMSDPRYDPSSFAYDAGFRKETDDLYRRAYG